MKRKIILPALIILALLGFLAREPLKNLYLSVGKNLQRLETNLKAAGRAELPPLATTSTARHISAPGPLRVIKRPAAALKPTPATAIILPPLSALGTLKETNHQRQIYHLSALAENKKLDAAAAAKANDMFAKQYFEHISPAGIGPSELVTARGYAYILVGENLALGNFTNDLDLLTAWMNSPGHRANILNPRYTEIGVAVVRGTYQGERVWIAVQEFGLPKSACPAPSAQLRNTLDAAHTAVTNSLAILEAKKSALDAMPQNDPGYNDAVREYNALVAQYNALVNTYKTLVAQYNAQINAFNACAQG